MQLSQNLTSFCQIKSEAEILHNVKLTYAGFNTQLTNGFGSMKVSFEIYYKAV